MTNGKRRTGNGKIKMETKQRMCDEVTFNLGFVSIGNFPVPRFRINIISNCRIAKRI